MLKRISDGANGLSHWLAHRSLPGHRDEAATAYDLDNAFMGLEALEPRLLLSGAPYIGASSTHDVQVIDYTGILGFNVHYGSPFDPDGTSDPQAGIIRNGLAVATEVIGGITALAEDSVRNTFTATATGWHDIITSGLFSGSVYSVAGTVPIPISPPFSLPGQTGAAFLIGVQTAVYDGSAVLPGSQGAAPFGFQEAPSILDAVGEQLLGAITSALDLGLAGEILDAYQQIQQVAVPVASWDQEPFTLFTSAYLEAGHTYAWEVSAYAYLGSGTVALGGHAAFSDSTTEIVDVTVQPRGATTQPPVVASLSDSPDPVTSGNDLLLVAHGVSDPDGGAIQRVDFYRDSNFTGQLEPNLDQLLGSTTSVSGGQAAILRPADFGTGIHRYFARALDDEGQWSQPASILGTVIPAGPDAGYDLNIWATGWNDRDGDGDGYPEAGEDIECSVILENVGNSPVTNVRAWLSTSVGNVHIIDNDAYYDTINPGNYKISGNRFNMFLDFASTWIELPFTLHVTYMKNGTEYWQNLTFTKTFYEDGVRAPQIVVDHIVWDDSKHGDGDGVLESGEEADMYIWLRNIGNAKAEHVDVMVQDPDEFEIYLDWVRYPDLFDGGSAVQAINGGHFHVRNVPVNLSGTVYIDVTVRYGEAENLFYTIQNVEIPVEAAPYLRAEWAESSDAQLDFGVVSPGNPVTRQLRLTNYGTAPLTIHQLAEGYADTAITGFTPGTVLAPGASTEATVSINTSGMNATIMRDIVVQSNGHDGWPGAGATQTVRLGGTVTESAGRSWEEVFSLYGHGLLKGLDVGDTDGDGNREIVTLGDWSGNPEIKIFERTGDNQYVLRWSHTLTTSGYLSYGVDLLRVDDINGDGKDDIVCGVYSDGASNGKLFLIESSADNAWSVTWSSLTNGILHELITGDSDGDGRKEIIYSTYWHADSGHGHLYVLENRGGTTFSQILDVRKDESDGSAYRHFGGMAVGDSDRDGRPEIVFTAGSRASGSSTHEAQFFIYEATGDNSYTQRYAGLSYDVDDVDPWSFARTAIGDPDGDGLMEIVVVEEAKNRLFIIESTADNSWDVAPTSWEYSTTWGRDAWVVMLENVDDDPQPEILVGFNVGGPALVILDGFATDSYVELWQSPISYNDVYAIAVDQTDASGNPRILVGSESGSDVDPDIKAYGEVTPVDVAVNGAGFTATPGSPFEGDAVTLSATVWNTQASTVSNVRVRFYDDDPVAGGAQIGDDQVIDAIAGGGSAVVQVVWEAIGPGSHELFVVADLGPGRSETNETNNVASRAVVVSDDDILGPVILGVTVADELGDGDGLVGADEKLRLSWQLSDPSGIGLVSLWIDFDQDGLGEPGSRDPDDEVTLAGDYYAIVGPLDPGAYNFVIEAADADVSPAATTYYGQILIVEAEEITVRRAGEALHDGQLVAIDFGRILQGSPSAVEVLTIHNDGQQQLQLGAVGVPGQFMASVPAKGVLMPGESTYTIISLATDLVGAFAGYIEIASSDGPRSPDELNEDIFTIPITGQVFALVPGDFNGDGGVTTEDINPFVLALTDPAGYALAYPYIESLLIDPNGDGLINTEDINAFIVLLTGQLNADLVAHYTFDGHVNDVSGSGFHGSANGGVTYAGGVIGQAAVFDGIDDWIVASHDGSLNFDVYNEAYSVSVLLQSQQLAGSGYVLNDRYNWGPGTGAAYDITVQPTNPSFNLSSNTWAWAPGQNFVENTATVDDLYGQWHHVVLVNEPGVSKRLYVDGQLVDTQLPPVPGGSSENTTDGLMIGARYRASDGGPSGFFAGLLDELRIYGRALSGGEVSLLAAEVLRAQNLAGGGSGTSLNVDAAAGEDVATDAAFMPTGGPWAAASIPRVSARDLLRVGDADDLDMDGDVDLLTLLGA